MNDSQNEGFCELARALDRLESIICGMDLPLPDNIHVAGLRGALPKIHAALKTAYFQAGGENYWSTGEHSE